MSDEVAVRVTLGMLGSGERELELSPGDVIRETFGEPAYVEVEVLNAEGPDGLDVDVDDTTFEQEQRGDDRVVEPKENCDNCGTLFNRTYSRCPNCGTPSQS